MLAHKIDFKLYKPVSSYITYDFVTMNNNHVKINQPKATKIENTLHLLSLAFIVVINFEIVSKSK
jgi:ABC-type polysaccharide transport system permease subunit